MSQMTMTVFEIQDLEHKLRLLEEDYELLDWDLEHMLDISNNFLSFIRPDIDALIITFMEKLETNELEREAILIEIALKKSLLKFIINAGKGGEKPIDRGEDDLTS